MDVIGNFHEIFNDLIKEKEINNQELSRGLGTSEDVILIWKHQYKNLKLKTLIKIAEYFNCSIDYLCGRTKNQLDFTPKECPKFCEWLPQVMKQNSKSSYRLFKETSIKSSQYHKWRKGIEPLLTSLDILADYLGITIDSLVGRDRRETL